MRRHSDVTSRARRANGRPASRHDGVVLREAQSASEHEQPAVRPPKHVRTGHQAAVGGRRARGVQAGATDVLQVGNGRTDVVTVGRQVAGGAGHGRLERLV